MMSVCSCAKLKGLNQFKTILVYSSRIQQKDTKKGSRIWIYFDCLSSMIIATTKYLVLSLSNIAIISVAFSLLLFLLHCSLSNFFRQIDSLNVPNFIWKCDLCKSNILIAVRAIGERCSGENIHRDEKKKYRNVRMSTNH